MIKYFLFISVSLASLTAKSFSQKADFTVNDLHDVKIMKVLFDAKEIDTSGEATWRPNFAEAQEFNVSYDSLCHTILDTVIQYKVHTMTLAVLIFETYGYQALDQPFGCNYCGPDISIVTFYKQEDNKWRFEGMEKHLTRVGSYDWGRPQIALRKFADDSYLIELSSNDDNRGYSFSYITYFDLEHFKEIFSAVLHEDNLGIAENKKNQYSWDKKLSFIASKKPQGYYDLEVSTSGTHHKRKDNENSPIVNFSERQKYRFDEMSQRYIPSR